MKYRKFSWSFLFIIMAACNSMAPSNPKEMEPCTVENILKAFDNSVEDERNDFIYLDHGYFELANCRITLYKNDEQWAMVFEKFGFNFRASTPVSIETTSFGNCLVGIPDGYLANVSYFDVANDIHDVLQKNGDTITIRGQKIRIPTDLASYKKYGIDWEDDGRKIRNYEGAVLKYLAETHPEITRATENELRQFVPSNLKKIMTIDSWYHEEYNFAFPTYLPSKQQTYQMIAKVLATGDTTYYKPTEKPNTHWSNYPDSGGL